MPGGTIAGCLSQSLWPDNHEATDDNVLINEDADHRENMQEVMLSRNGYILGFYGR